MSRRARGEGSVGAKPLKDGRWQSRISWRDEAGRLHRKAFYGSTRAEAAAKLNDGLTELRKGQLPRDERKTVRAFLEAWAAGGCKGHGDRRSPPRPSTVECYESIVRIHLVPGLGHLRLAHLSPMDVQRFLDEKAKGKLSPRTVDLMRAVLRRALNVALAWGEVSRNAAALAAPPTPVRRRLEPLDGDQVKAFLAGTADDRLGALYVVAFSTGLRQGEILALRWEDVNLTEGALRVARNLAKGKHMGEPKSARGARTIALPTFTVEALAAHRERQRAERAALRAWEDSGIVFSNEIGGHLTPWGLTRAFKGHLRRLELPPQRFHDCRHAAASLLLAQGVHARVVMEILGHSTINVTLDIYSHVSPALSREAAASMERALG